MALCSKKSNYTLSFLVASTITLLAGCSNTPDLEQYAKQSPQFDLYNFFNGQVTAWGIVQNRSGNVTQRFRVSIDGKIEGNVLILDERFKYFQGDGVKRRVWEINSENTSQLGQYKGEASDIQGPAYGATLGNALNWRYEMNLTVKSGTYRVKFDDWMWLVDENTLINRAYIKKFGLVMAEVTLVMRKSTIDSGYTKHK